MDNDCSIKHLLFFSSSDTAYATARTGKLSFIPALPAEDLNQETTNVSLLVFPDTSTPDLWKPIDLLDTNLTSLLQFGYTCNGSLFGRDFNP